jgi:hypothetical protein
VNLWHPDNLEQENSFFSIVPQSAETEVIAKAWQEKQSGSFF